MHRKSWLRAWRFRWAHRTDFKAEPNTLRRYSTRRGFNRYHFHLRGAFIGWIHG
jgi:hypothetical protein